MDKQARETTLSVLRAWAARHSKPDEPMLSMGRELLSPNQIVTAIEEETEDGCRLIRMIDLAAQTYGLDSILESLRLEEAPKAGPQIGDRMPDGTIYAGISPDTRQPMYARPRDESGTYTFNEAAKHAKTAGDGFHVPSKDELKVLWENRNKGQLKGTFNETGSEAAGWYWSSTSDSSLFASVRRFSDGDQGHLLKAFDQSLRLVRG
jgi:hypothetical protein